MKCLIIASDIGITAPGIVYETVTRELVKYADISVITPMKREGVDLPVTYLKTASKGYAHYRIAHTFMSVFGANLFDEYWLLRQKWAIDEDIIKQQDIVISFVSFHHYKGVMLGSYLATKYKKKWVIYSVDAIPAPIGWCEEGRFYWNTRKFISSYISHCDAFFSANEQMLRYQLEPLGTSPKLSGVLYTPIRSDLIVDFSPASDIPTFLYTGGLYGPRKKEALLDGFRLLIKDYPKACLVFVGINRPEIFDSYKDLIATGNLKLYGYTHDLRKFYQLATILIDINAYFDNDVFLSSKIVNYLTIRKPIISITGLNSPSRNIFTEDSSFFHCRHDAHEIYLALKQSLDYECNDWRSRDKYIEMFSVESVVKSFVEVLNGLYNE